MRFESKPILILTLACIILTLNYQVNCQGSKRNYESCRKNEECASKSCASSKCAPLKCRNDKACLKAGLSDHYCRRRTIFKIFKSECVPKRGLILKNQNK